MILRINAKATFLGGQSFLWIEDEGCLYAFHSDFVLRAINLGEEKFKIEQVWGDEISLSDYFQLSYNEIARRKLLSEKDKYLKPTLENLGNLYILSQPFFDVLFSFILSSNNRIGRIRKLNLLLAENLGKKIKIKDKIIYTYPGLYDFANSDEEFLRTLGLGFRAKYIIESAKFIASNSGSFDNSNIDSIKKLAGVGDKIADCALVFSGTRHDITPVDVWMKRIVSSFYKFEAKKYDEYRDFFIKNWGNLTALKAQYLFEYYRTFGADTLNT